VKSNKRFYPKSSNGFTPPMNFESISDFCDVSMLIVVTSLVSSHYSGKKLLFFFIEEVLAFKSDKFFNLSLFIIRSSRAEKLS